VPRIYFIDVTNRDGDQTARIGLAKLQKTVINVLLGEFGVHQSEFGFPFSFHEVRYLNANIELQERGAIGNLILSGWCRATVADAKTTLTHTRVRHVNLSTPTSDQMVRSKFRGRVSRQEITRRMSEAVDAAKQGGALSIGVNAEDASRTEIDYLIEFAGAAREHGADRVRYCDTLGCDDPFSIYDRIHRLAKGGGLPVEAHCHNDLGLAVGASIAGALGCLDAGYDAYINTTVNGIGERAGNADLLSCVLAIRHCPSSAGRDLLGPRIDLKKAWRLANYVAEAFGVPIPLNQVGVGGNAFAHESGIHADGALKDRRNYELYDLEELGRGEPYAVETGREILTGTHGGAAGLAHVLQTRLGVQDPPSDKVRQVLHLVQLASLTTQKPLTTEELRLIWDHPDIAEKLVTLPPP
jgi:isopropylmalate/homocitrate/citramalate synthase